MVAVKEKLLEVDIRVHPGDSQLKDIKRGIINVLIALLLSVENKAETFRHELLAFSNLIDGRGEEELPRVSEEENAKE